MKTPLEELKSDIIADIRMLIEVGEKVDDVVLPKNPIKIEVVGKSARDLKLHVIYRNEAPYFFDVVVYDL